LRVSSVGKEVGRIEILAIDRVPEERGESMRKYWQLEVKGAEASIFIYGDIVSEPWKWYESDVTSYDLVKEIEGLDVDVIHCYINSYGGEVAEGLAIYNALRRHKAKVRTVCDGFACSAASVVFMAGDERVMSNASLLMIHNAWLLTVGDQNGLRRDADDLEVINAATIQAYLNHVNISEDKLKEMMDAETWISAADALEMGFSTEVVNPATTGKAAASLRQKMVDIILSRQSQRSSLDVDALAARLKELMAQEKPEPEPESDPEPEPEPEPEPQSKGLFDFMAALAARLEGDE
jgi:ATP-dependent Clp protease protease subunit